MSDTEKHDVLVKMTKEEYENALVEARDGEETGRPQLVLLGHTMDLDVWEQDIPLAVRDALQEACGEAEQEELRVSEQEPMEVDVSGWPFDLKREVMTRAKDEWHPRIGKEDSFWMAAEAARRMVREMPELKLLFREGPETVAKAWEQRNSAPANAD